MSENLLTRIFHRRGAENAEKRQKIKGKERKLRNCNKTFTAEFAETAEKKDNGFGSTTPEGVVMVHPWFQFLCALRVSAVMLEILRRIRE